MYLNICTKWVFNFYINLTKRSKLIDFTENEFEHWIINLISELS